MQLLKPKKTAILFAVFLFVLLSPVEAEAQFGIKVGTNVTTFIYESTAKENLINDYRRPKIDAVGGFLYRHNINKVLYVEPQLQYSRKGLKYKQPGVKAGKTFMNFVEIPVLAGIKIAHNRFRAWELGFGPYGAFWTDGKYYSLSYKSFQESETKIDFSSETVKYNRWDTGVFAQVAYEKIQSDNSWVFALRYQHGMLGSSEEFADPVRHRHISATISYLFAK